MPISHFIGSYVKVTLFVVFFHSLFSDPSFAVDYRAGDIIFVNMECKICDTIKKTSHSLFSHIGIIVTKGEEVFVVEAYNGVKKIPLKKFLKRSLAKGKYSEKDYRYAVGRVANSQIAQKAAVYADSLIGKPFDNHLSWGEEKIYCSELVYFAYKNASPDKELFTPRPMNFTIRQDIWDKYFRGRMPQGRLGMYPQDFIESKHLNIVYSSEN